MRCNRFLKIGNRSLGVGGKIFSSKCTRTSSRRASTIFSSGLWFGINRINTRSRIFATSGDRRIQVPRVILSLSIRAALGLFIPTNREFLWFNRLRRWAISVGFGPVWLIFIDRERDRISSTRRSFSNVDNFSFDVSEIFLR